MNEGFCDNYGSEEVDASSLPAYSPSSTRLMRPINLVIPATVSLLSEDRADSPTDQRWRVEGKLIALDIANRELYDEGDGIFRMPVYGLDYATAEIECAEPAQMPPLCVSGVRLEYNLSGNTTSFYGYLASCETDTKVEEGTTRYIFRVTIRPF